jgi:cobalt-zinc-cadmium resistance protein CzcA
MFRLPGISAHESLHGNEVTDPMALDQSDVYVMLKPREQWPTKRSKEDLIAAMRERISREAPGAGYSFSQPIQMRMQEPVETGSRSDVAVKINGDDLDVLRDTAEKIAAILRNVKGAVDVKAERVAGLPYLRIKVRRDAIARHGLNVADVLDTVGAVGGKVVGQVVDGNRRYALQVRFQQEQRATADAIRNLKIGDSEGHFIPLSQLADVWDEEGPAQISRENAQRRISVETNVRGCDLAGFVSEAQQAIEQRIKFPQGCSIAWGGQFEQLQTASGRLAIAVPIALLIILASLYFNFGSLRPAALIFLNIPLAATGGILALLVRGMPFSITAGVGFIVLFGIAVLNGVVLLTYVTQLRQQAEELPTAVERGAITRLRPVLMTALAASLGFIPMAVSTAPEQRCSGPLQLWLLAV